MQIATQVLFPVLLILSIGFFLERWRPLDPRTLSQTSIYVLGPSLVFYSLSTTRLSPQEFFHIAGFLYLLTLLLWLATRGIVYLKKGDASEESILMLCTLFNNSGNYGMPVAYYAFGQEGLERAIIWVLLQNATLSSLAIYYAARSRLGPQEAFRTVFKMPVIWSALVAGVLRLIGVPIPSPILEPLHNLGLAMIPIAQLLLGVQLSRSLTTLRADIRRIAMVCFLRLVLSPLLAFPLAHFLGLFGVTRNTLVLLSGMPTAVNASILATEFNAEPKFVSAVVFVTTLLSFFTLLVLLNLLV